MLIGSQVPRLSSVPPYTSSPWEQLRGRLAGLGFSVDEWQSNFLRDSLGRTADGLFSARNVLLIVPRQNGKNHILAARQLVGLLFAGERAIHSAHQLATAAEHMTFLKRVIEDMGLSDLFKIKSGNMEMSIQNLRTGAKLVFKARSGDAARGFAGYDALYLDEAYGLSDDELAAILPTIAAKSMAGKMQMWLTSSAGMPGSDVLRRFRETCIDGAENWLYAEWSVDEDADINDVRNWAAANPAFNIRISEDYIRNNEITVMGREQFARERLGVWSDDSGDTVISRKLWRNGNVKEIPDADEACLALEVSPDGSHVALSLACGFGADPEDTFVQVLAYDTGYSWVAPAVKALYAARKIKGLYVDSRGAVLGLLPVLQREGLNPVLLNMTDVQAACEGLLKGLRAGQVSHLEDVDVEAVVTSAQRRPIGEIGWAWRRASELDISPLVSLTFAHYAWVKYATKKARRAVKVVALPL